MPLPLYVDTTYGPGGGLGTSLSSLININDLLVLYIQGDVFNTGGLPTLPTGWAMWPGGGTAGYGAGTSDGVGTLVAVAYKVAVAADSGATINVTWGTQVINLACAVWRNAAPVGGAILGSATGAGVVAGGSAQEDVYYPETNLQLIFQAIPRTGSYTLNQSTGGPVLLSSGGSPWPFTVQKIVNPSTNTFYAVTSAPNGSACGGATVRISSSKVDTVPFPKLFIPRKDTSWRSPN